MPLSFCDLSETCAEVAEATGAGSQGTRPHTPDGLAFGPSEGTVIGVFVDSKGKVLVQRSSSRAEQRSLGFDDLDLYRFAAGGGFMLGNSMRLKLNG